MQRKQKQNKFKQRYHVTDEFLENFFDSVVFEGNHINKFLKDVKSKYVVNARLKYQNYLQKDVKNLSKIKMNAIASKLYKSETFKGILSMIGYGYIDPINQKVFTILYKTYQHILCGDASHTILNILGKQDGMYNSFLFTCNISKAVTYCLSGNKRKLVLKTSGFRVVNKNGYKLGDTWWLERGGESKFITLHAMAEIIANNMRQCLYFPKTILYDQIKRCRQRPKCQNTITNLMECDQNLTHQTALFTKNTCDSCSENTDDTIIQTHDANDSLILQDETQYANMSASPIALVSNNLSPSPVANDSLMIDSDTNDANSIPLNYIPDSNSDLSFESENCDNENEQSKSRNQTQTKIKKSKAISTAKRAFLDQDDAIEQEFIQNVGPHPKDCVNIGQFLHYHLLSLDFATNCNVDSLRIVLVNLIKHQLQDLKHNKEWINQQTLNTFNWEDYFLIVCQEIIHIYIRFRKEKCFNWQHADCLWIMKNVRAIISGIRTHYDINSAPPVVDGINKYHPYDLIQKCPYNLTGNQQLFEDLQELLDIQYQLKSTKRPELISKLLSQKRKITTPESVLIEILQWLCDHSVPEHQLSWSSVFEVGIKKWQQVTLDSYIYLTQQDKDNVQKKPQKIKMPFYKNGITQWEQISLLLKSKGKQDGNYDAICGPYVSCLDLTSYFESLFVFSFIFSTFWYHDLCQIFEQVPYGLQLCSFYTP